MPDDLPASVPPPGPPDPLAAEAVAAQAAEPARTRGHAHSAGNTHCQNCGAELKGPYCHACGQHDFDVNQSFWHTFLEALENLFHFEGKFFRNIVTLLFQPGRLTAEFNAGKRASQMPPFRLYIFTAFVFFLWVFSHPTLPAAALDVRPDRPAKAAPAPAAEANKPHLTLKSFDKPPEQMTDTERWIEHQVERTTKEDFREKLVHTFMAAMPKLLMVCLPLFALLTRLFFRGRGQLYLQHLVLALHFHTFIYLWIMLRDGWAFVADLPGWGLGGWVTLAGNLWLTLYPLFMLRRLFGNSWPWTLAKTFALTVVYSLTLGAVFMVGFVVLVLAL